MDFNKENWEKNDGPIPGENFTSNTKNYPWHRPPDITNMDKAVELFLDKVVRDKKRGPGVITLLNMGVPISTVTSIFVKQGIMGGKWTTDYAILVAGPIARIIEMMAKGAGIEYITGWEDENTAPTMSYFDKLNNPEPMDSQSILQEAQSLPEPEVSPAEGAPETGGLLQPPQELNKLEGL
jgi:hypothetical protein